MPKQEEPPVQTVVMDQWVSERDTSVVGEIKKFRLIPLRYPQQRLDLDQQCITALK